MVLFILDFFGGNKFALNIDKIRRRNARQNSSGEGQVLKSPSSSRTLVGGFFFDHRGREKHGPSTKLTWQAGTSSFFIIFHRRYTFKGLFFHCHVSFRGCKTAAARGFRVYDVYECLWVTVMPSTSYHIHFQKLFWLNNWKDFFVEQFW